MKLTSMTVPGDLVRMVLIALMEWQTTLVAVLKGSLEETAALTLMTVQETPVEMAERVLILWLDLSAPVPQAMLVTPVRSTQMIV